MLDEINVGLFAEDRYLAEVDPEPREADSAFDFVTETETPYINLRYYSTENFLLSSIAVETILLQVVSYSTL